MMLNSINLLSTVLELTDAILTISIRLQEASNVLKKAHVEGWTDDDKRWDDVWKDADNKFTDALDKLKA